MSVPAIVFLSIVGATAAEFPQPFDSGDAAHRERPPVAAHAAVRTLALPVGFRADVVAAEPAVRNPIAMAWDDRGRLWLAENFTYAERGVKFEAGLRDRILVLDPDMASPSGFKPPRVFHDGVQRLTSVEVGLGGVWLMCPPQLLFVPDDNGDAVPDGPARVVLDGFTVSEVSHHNFANGLRFGPDGWLYGRCGGSSPAEVGLPLSPAAARVPVRGGMWRFHPRDGVFEAITSGTTNPWGHDWDDRGELFFINTVNGHLWHGIMGSHLQRQNTLEPNPHVYELIDQHADHWHFDTKRSWQQSRDGAANGFGGGHAHVGMAIYQGNQWPERYRGGLFTINFHGRRANHERLERHGSGYIGRHEPDFFLSADPWFRGIDLSFGPNDALYVIDWSDTGECHNSTGVNRSSGRVFRIGYGDAVRREAPRLREATGAQLVEQLRSADPWHERQARRELASRSARGATLEREVAKLREMLANDGDVRVVLRALWALHVIGRADRPLLRGLLRHGDEYVRAWAVRLLTDSWPLDTVMSARPARAEKADTELVREFAALARIDPSALVRLALASVLQRLPVGGMRELLAGALLTRREDAADHNLPLLVWYGLIPVGNSAPEALVELAAAAEWPTVRRLAARRLASDLGANGAPFAALLERTRDRPLEVRADIVLGAAQALVGWHKAPPPLPWPDYARRMEGETLPEEVRRRLRELGVVFGDGRALAEVKALALDARAEPGARRAALESLLEARPPELRGICERLLRVRHLAPIAARGLARFDDPAIGELIANAYGAFFQPADRSGAIDVLVSRPDFAHALLAYVADGKIPRHAITAFHARQIRGLGDRVLTARLADVWGEWRDTAEEKKTVVVEMKRALPPDVLARANLSAGRGVFEQRCAACHKLHGEGSALGPDLTGANRANLDYLLQNIVDPGAEVAADFRNAAVRLRDGRVLNGFISARTERTLTVRSMNAATVVERAEVAAIEESRDSLMPEGLLNGLSAEEQRDLIGYLMSPTQVGRPE